MTRSTTTGHHQSTSRRRRGTRLEQEVLAALLALAAVTGSAVAAADGAAATTTAAATAAATSRLGASKPASAKGGLAAFATRTELKGTTNEDGKISISNGSLSQTSGGGTLSVGGGVTASTGAGAPQPESDVPAAPPATATWDKSVAEQQKKIESLEKDLADFDQKVAAGTDPYRANNSQNRAPGQVEQSTLERDKATQLIAAEKARLDEMKRQNRREGADTQRK